MRLKYTRMCEKDHIDDKHFFQMPKPQYPPGVIAARRSSLRRSEGLEGGLEEAGAEAAVGAADVDEALPVAAHCLPRPLIRSIPSAKRTNKESPYTKRRCRVPSFETLAA